MSDWPDNTGVFRNFKQTIPKKPGTLPIPPLVNIKDVLIAWLSYRFGQMNLSDPVVVLGDYPSETMLSMLPVGEDGQLTANRIRGVSIVLLDGSVSTRAIGQVMQGATHPMIDTINDKTITGEPEELQYGWYETLQVEISYWSLSSRDRDRGGDLVRTLVFEAFRNGWLRHNGVVIMELSNYYDTSDSRMQMLNRAISYSVSTFTLVREFFGTVSADEYDKFIEEVQVHGTFGEEIDLNDKTYNSPYEYFASIDLDAIVGGSGMICLPNGGGTMTFESYQHMQHASYGGHPGVCLDQP